MFGEYDVVKLKKDIPSSGLVAGAIGAIVMVYSSNPPEYEVEFVDQDGNTLALVTLSEDEIELVKKMS